MFVYYISFDGDIAPFSINRAWAIRRTNNNMDTMTGLETEIEAIEKERGYPIRIIFFKRLKDE